MQVGKADGQRVNSRAGPFPFELDQPQQVAGNFRFPVCRHAAIAVYQFTVPVNIVRRNNSGKVHRQNVEIVLNAV